MRTLPFIACLLLGLGSASGSQQAILQVDNDLFTGSDRNYTNGLRLAYIQEIPQGKGLDPLLTKSLQPLSDFARRLPISQLQTFEADELRYAWGCGLTQLMFTPEERTTALPPAGERPYAGWLGFEFSLHAKSDDAVSGLTLTLGTTGDASLAGETQDWWHGVIGSSLFQGWDSQVPAEMTLNLHLDYKRRLGFFDPTETWPLQLDGYYEWGGALGNFRTDAYVGGLLRCGYNLPATYSVPRIQLGSYGHALFKEDPPDQQLFSVVAFAGLRGTTVLHDITLDGTVFRDGDTSTESEPLVGEFIYGLSIRYGWLELSASRTRRSDEFEGQARNHSFGSFMVRLGSRF